MKKRNEEKDDEKRRKEIEARLDEISSELEKLG